MSVHDPFIARGFVLLDEKVPGWEHRVDLKTLDLGSWTRCVVGQLFDVQKRELLWEGFSALGVESPRAYGFSLNWDLHHAATYGGLTNAWKRAIRARRAGRQP